MLLAVAATTATCGAAFSLDIASPANRPAVILQRGNELLNMENRINRQQFQFQQQQFRAQDRDPVQQMPKPDVPSIGQKCRLQASGGGLVNSCR